MRKNFITAFILSAVISLAGCTSSDAVPAETSSVITETTAASTTTAVESVQTFIESVTETVTVSETQTAASDTSHNNTELDTKAVEATKAETTAVQQKDFTDDMTVHFIDVGQGDSIFIELPNGENMLIDAGETTEGDKVAAYIFAEGYDTLDYVVATHPHSDHIGGMADVVNSFNVENFYMTSAESTTKVYENMLKAVKDSKADVHNVIAGDIILDKTNLLIEVVAPKTLECDDLNDTSVVLKLTYGDRRFLFTGDAEKAEEDGIWTNIKCDVLKVGHHGSDSSSSANFLKKAEPSYAVISVGMGNSYGHPTDVVLKRLADRNIDVYRTDTQGTIVFTTDGKDISVNVKPSVCAPVVETTVTTAAVTKSESNGIEYVLNTNSKKIHYPDCSSVKKMKEKNKGFTTDYDGAIADGYTPCGNCKP